MLVDIASEAFMPLAYGGGIGSVDDIRKILHLGFEKVVLNTAAARDTSLISKAAAAVGAVLGGGVGRRAPHQVGATPGGDALWAEKIDVSVEEYVRRVVDAGAGEVLLQSIDRDGMQSGYDIELIEQIAHLTPVPVVALGGVVGVDDLGRAIAAGASAAAAGSMFVFTGKHDAVLISYPARGQGDGRPRAGAALTSAVDAEPAPRHPLDHPWTRFIMRYGRCWLRNPCSGGSARRGVRRTR